MALSRLKKAYYTSVTSALVQLVTILCGMITSRLIIQTYGSSWNGIIVSISRMLQLITIAEIGLDGAARVALYRSLASNDQQKTNAIINANQAFYQKICLFFIVYIAILTVFLPGFIQAEQSNRSIALMILIVGFSSLAEHCWGINSKIILLATQSRYITNLVQIAAVLLNAGLIVLVVTLQGNIFTAKAASGAVLTLKPLLLFLIVKRLFKLDKTVKPDHSALKDRWNVMANSLSNIVHHNVDLVFLTLFCAATEISVYSLYMVIAGGLSKLFTILTSGMEAGFGSLWARNEHQKLEYYLRQFEYIIYSFSVILFGCMIVLILPFMSLYVSRVTDANYLRFNLGLTLAIAEIFLSIRAPYVLLVQAAGHYKQVKIGAYCEAGLNIILTLVLAKLYGIVGAVAATAVANIFRTIQYSWYASKHLIQRPFMQVIRRLVWLCVMLCICVCTSYGAISSIVIDSWIGWCTAATICLLVHISVIFLGTLLFYRSDFQIFLRTIKKLL